MIIKHWKLNLMNLHNKVVCKRLNFQIWGKKIRNWMMNFQRLMKKLLKQNQFQTDLQKKSRVWRKKLILWNKEQKGIRKRLKTWRISFHQLNQLLVMLLMILLLKVFKQNWMIYKKHLIWRINKSHHKMNRVNNRGLKIKHSNNNLRRRLMIWHWLKGRKN